MDIFVLTRTIYYETYYELCSVHDSLEDAMAEADKQVANGYGPDVQEIWKAKISPANSTEEIYYRKRDNNEYKDWVYVQR